MSRTSFLASCLLLIGMVTALTAASSPAPVVARYNIQGMFCGTCVDQLTRTAQGVEGVSRVEVNVEARRVTVTYDNAKTNAEAIRAHVNRETAFRLALAPPQAAPGQRTRSSRRCC